MVDCQGKGQKESEKSDLGHEGCERQVWEIPLTIIDHGGGNDFVIPHMGKERLERDGQLPQVIDVTEGAREFFNYKNFMLIPKQNQY